MIGLSKVSIESATFPGQADAGIVEGASLVLTSVISIVFVGFTAEVSVSLEGIAATVGDTEDVLVDGLTELEVVTEPGLDVMTYVDKEIDWLFTDGCGSVAVTTAVT